jgi:hypothetical protein
VSGELNYDGPWALTLTQVHGDITTYASLLSPSSKIAHPLASDTVRGYLANIMVSGYRAPSETPEANNVDRSQLAISLGGQTLELGEGDGAFVQVPKGSALELEIANSGSRTAEFLWFEISS